MCRRAGWIRPAMGDTWLGLVCGDVAPSGDWGRVTTVSAIDGFGREISVSVASSSTASSISCSIFSTSVEQSDRFSLLEPLELKGLSSGSL